jgi:hypothetical protein
VSIYDGEVISEALRIVFDGAQLADTKFQRSFVPLKLVIDNGAMSMRQKDCGGAPIA